MVTLELQPRARVSIVDEINLNLWELVCVYHVQWSISIGEKEFIKLYFVLL